MCLFKGSHLGNECFGSISLLSSLGVPQSNRCLTTPCSHSSPALSHLVSLCVNQLYVCLSPPLIHQFLFRTNQSIFSTPVTSALNPYLTVLSSQPFTVLSNTPPISPLLPPTALLLFPISSSVPPSCPPHYPPVSVVMAAINQLVLNQNRTLKPQTTTPAQKGSFLFPRGPLDQSEQDRGITIETIENKKQILDNIPQGGTCNRRTTGFIVLDMLGILEDFPLDLISPGILGSILLCKTGVFKVPIFFLAQMNMSIKFLLCMSKLCKKYAEFYFFFADCTILHLHILKIPFCFIFFFFKMCLPISLIACQNTLLV